MERISMEAMAQISMHLPQGSSMRYLTIVRQAMVIWGIPVPIAEAISVVEITSC